MNPSSFKVVRASDNDDSLMHWGIRGMHWGIRRYQNEDGSLTEEGRRHYGVLEKREEAKSRERMEREKAKAQIKVTRAEAKARIQIANEQARANAAMQAKIAREQAKAQAKVAKEQGKAEALKAKAANKAQVDIAKQDVKGITTEAKEVTKQKKAQIQAQIQDDRVRAIQNNAFRKLLLGGAAVAGAAVLISAWRGTSASSEKVASAAKDAKSNPKIKGLLSKTAKSLVSENKALTKDNEFLRGEVANLKSAIAKNGETAAQSIIEAFKTAKGG